MTHLARRNTKRVQFISNSDSKFGSELAALLAILFQIILIWFRWIESSFVNLHLISHRNYEEVPEVPQAEEEEEINNDEPGALVVARGVGLMAAYTGRRAMFAIYPASGEGLEVSSKGPAPLSFEYKKKDDLFLVGYVPPTAGKYHLQVARFGKKAVGSPFLLRVDDPPPGYVGTFGAALWHERPPQPPLLSGIVDFVTEKMFLTEDGRLVRLNKQGTDMVPVQDPKPTNNIQQTPNRLNAEKDVENDIKESNKVHIPPPEEEAPLPRLKTNEEFKKIVPVKKQVVSRIENILSAINRDTKKDPQEKYKYVSKALMKELSLSLKILNLLGSESLSPPENSPDYDTKKREFQIPEIMVSEEPPRATEGCNQSEADRFLSKHRESRYAAQRPAKLAWYWGDDAVTGEACDAAGQAGRREGLIGSILQAGRNPKPWRKNPVSGLLGLRKSQELTGVRLLHNIYKPSDCHKEIDTHKACSAHFNQNLNNSNPPKTEYQTIDVKSERNNLEPEKRNLSIKNDCRKDLVFKRSDSFKNTSNIEKENKWRTRDLRANGTFRTLSLPDFNRILSLSVQGLRHAKSCGDRSFKAMSSSSFSMTLKNLFEREHVYNLSNAQKVSYHKARKAKNEATLIKMNHFGSDRDNRKLQSGVRSVDEMKKYWEEKQVENSDVEFGRGCSLEITGIVDRGKAIFESSPDSEIPEIKIFEAPKLKTDNTKTKQTFENSRGSQNSFTKPREMEKSPIILTPSPISNKTAFQKAKDMFEGNYNPKDIHEEKDNRKKSISERFHVSSLSRDIYSGVTPELLGVPNRVPAVASLGSVYHPEYPHPPLTPTRTRNYRPGREQYVYPAWDMLLYPDPSLV